MMIGQLRGELLAKQAPDVLLDINGIGYEIAVPMTTYFDLPDVGQVVTLATHFVVREDAQLLFGFLSKSDRDLFRILIKVSGIGPKVGLAILSGLSASELVKCIRQGDKAALVKLPGIGPKTAERLIMETRDKLKEGWVSSSRDTSAPSTEADIADDDPVAQAEAALESLGYKKAEAIKAVAKAMAATDGKLNVEALIRSALRSLF